uniref:SSD domain-containing protein n=1 Tax=Rhabditophanes sp. KR3021 TaxID=114890 RepID=A0AC35U3H7_9BILA
MAKVFDSKSPQDYDLKEISSTEGTSSETSSASFNSASPFILAIQKGYFVWAKYIARFPITVIIICLIFTAIGTIKMAMTPNVNDIAGYTPYGARSRYELKVSHEFGNVFGRGPTVFLSILPKDNDTMLREDLIDEAVKINELVMNNFTIHNRETHKTEPFKDFCYGYCTINEPLVQFAKAFKFQGDILRRNETLTDRIRLRYPSSQFFDHDFSLQYNFFGVTINDEVKPTDITNLKFVKMIGLFYMANRRKEWSDEDVKDFENQFTDYFTKYESPNLRVLPLSSAYVENEVVRAGMSNLPFLSVGFLIMVVCSCTTVMLSAFYMNQVTVHKLSLAFNACVCPFMACGTALGGLFFFGVRFGSVLCVTPFLVLAIGVDDAYLMIHSWQRVCKEMKKKRDPNDSVELRLGMVLQETGPAILISACTNILADCIGTFTGSPEITLLCVGNMTAVFVDFIYQITFYCAVMAIVGKFEMAGEKANEDKGHKLSISVGNEMVITKENGVSSETSVDRRRRKLRSCVNKMIDGYIKLLTNIWFNVATILGWLLFLVVCGYGITNMKILLTSEKLFALDSPLIEVNKLRETVIVPDFTRVSVYLTKPGDLTDKERLGRLNSLVEEFERLPESWGKNSTHYFLRDFMQFEKYNSEFIDEENAKNETLISSNKSSNNGYIESDIQEFIKWPEFEHWNGFVKLSEDKQKLDSFYFNVYYHGKELTDWVARSNLMDRMRKIVDSFKPYFNATVNNEDGIYFDLIENMPRDTLESTIATIICMGLVCSIFMFKIKPVLMAMTTIASIIVLMLGILFYTGSTLDPVIVPSILISIGFAIDIPCHVLYHFHVANKGQTKESVRHIKQLLKEVLTSIGFPACQAALSTSLCISSLLLVNVYMSRAFVKVMVCCLMLCLYHGLLIIPTLYCFIHYIKKKMRK